MENVRVRTIGIYAIMVLAGFLAGWLLLGRGDGADPEDHHHPTIEMAEAAETEYTCSMHPQVRQDEPGDCPICGMELIPVGEKDDHRHDDPFSFTMRESHRTWANIRTQRVSTAMQAHSIRLTGKVAVNEKETAVISAHFPGRVEKLYADQTGMMITAGERIAGIYSPEIIQAQTELIQAYSQRESQPRLYESASQRLRLLGITEQQRDMITKAGEVQTVLDIYAGQSGYLTGRLVSEGDYVNRGQPLLKVANLSNVWIELDAYEADFGLINIGDIASVEIPAIPGRNFDAVVDFIDPVIDPDTRSARVRATISNRDGILKPGMLANAILTPGKTEVESHLVVPSTAVLWTGKRSIVYVLEQDGEVERFEFREIETGPKTNEGYIVLSGLSDGEEIAVSGVFSIDAAAQLQGQYSMMSPPEKVDLPDNFRSNLERLYDIYFDLKNALADDDAADALEHASLLIEQLETTGEHSLDGEHHMFWMDQYSRIKDGVDNFLNYNELEKQREYFEAISEAFIETARTLGAIGQTWYVAFCPMYDDDRGAYWLSEFEQISNPYFGSMMLRCGEVRETIREGVGSSGTREESGTGVHVH